jgi:hypothetical protein
MSKITSLEKINVWVLNTQQFIELFKIKVPINQRLSIKKECLYKEDFMIDIDCLFSEVEQHYHKSKIQKTLSFNCRFDTKSESGWLIGTERFKKVITLKIFLEEAELLPITKFIRYNYNPRITSNQNLLLEYINNLENE